MARVQKTIDVSAPIRSVYNQWTQFEEFPLFMEGVRSVTQLDDRHLEWDANVAGKDKQWQAEIREQVPDQKIIWNSIDGSQNAGIVTFQPLGAGGTRVQLEMSYDTDGALEAVGDALGFIDRKVEGDLERFRDFIESRQEATGAYRETLANPDVPGGHTSGQPAASYPAEGTRAG